MRFVRYAIPALVLLLAVLRTASDLHWFGWHRPPQVQAADEPAAVPIGGPFELTASDGRRVTDRNFRGKWMLVYFGYTNCPDSCPTALNDIAGALDLLGDRRHDIAPLFITIDPRRDTPPVMAAYTAKFDPQILGLTGTPEQIAQVKRVYRVYASADAHPGHGGVMVMDHSSVMVILNPDGRFAAALNGDADAQTIAATLRALDPHRA